MILKIALGNVRRSVQDYSVYFATLCLATCLLYSFTAATDHLLALDLSAEARDALAKAGDIMQAFSVFVVVVFAFLVAYANRFIVRRRKREFGLYGLLGMRAGTVSLILTAESGVASALSLAAGISAGIALSPAFGLVTAFVFGAPWKLAWSASASAAAWTAACFVAVAVLASLIAMLDVARRPLVELLTADKRPERMRLATTGGAIAQAVFAVVLLGCVWASCVAAPMHFIVFILPMGVAATAGTCLLFRVAATHAQRRSGAARKRNLVGLRLFVTRQVSAKVESSSAAVACVCVLIAAAICMICAGLAFSVGIRAEGAAIESASALAPIGFVGIFYGMSFLVAAAAVLALQQLTETADNKRAYATLSQLGADERMMRGAVRQQVARYFAAPIAMALVHCAFGLPLVAFLAWGIGSASFTTIAGTTVGATLILLALYGLITCRACARVVIPRT